MAIDPPPADAVRSNPLTASSDAPFLSGSSQKSGGFVGVSMGNDTRSDRIPGKYGIQLGLQGSTGGDGFGGGAQIYTGLKSILPVPNDVGNALDQTDLMVGVRAKATLMKEDGFAALSAYAEISGNMALKAPVSPPGAVEEFRPMGLDANVGLIYRPGRKGDIALVAGYETRQSSAPLQRTSAHPSNLISGWQSTDNVVFGLHKSWAKGTISTGVGYRLDTQTQYDIVAGKQFRPGALSGDVSVALSDRLQLHGSATHTDYLGAEYDTTVWSLGGTLRF